MWDFQRRSGRVLRGALGAPRASWEALGKLDQVQWGPFGRVLDRQKMSEVRILREKLGGFEDFRFSLFSIRGRSREGPWSVFRRKGSAQGGPNRADQIFCGVSGGSPGRSGVAGGGSEISKRDRGVGSAECGGPGGGGGGYASRGRRNRLLPKDAQYPLGTADLKGFAMPPTPFLGSGTSF